MFRVCLCTNSLVLHQRIVHVHPREGVIRGRPCIVLLRRLYSKLSFCQPAEHPWRVWLKEGCGWRRGVEWGKLLLRLFDFSLHLYIMIILNCLCIKWQNTLEDV